MNDQITELLERRDAAVAKLTTAQAALKNQLTTMQYEANLSPSFRRFQIDVLRASLRLVGQKIDDLERVIAETDPVFDEVAQKIG